MDAFDKQMNALGDFLKYQAGAGDDYGRRPKSAFTVVLSAIACRITTITTRGNQKLGESGGTTIIRKAFLRPQSVSITNEMFLRVSGIIYRIKQVDNPSLLNHHLELWLEETET